MTFFTQLISLIFLALCLGCTREESEAIRIGYLPVVQALPLFVAEEEELFEHEGILATLVRLENPQHGIDGLLAGNLDLLVAGATGIAAVASEKAPDSLRILYVMGGGKDTFNDVLFTKAESRIKSISDLVGKKLGLFPGIQFSAIARRILEAHKIDVGLVKLQPLPAHLQVQALHTGQIDALLSLEPSFTIAKSIFPVRHIEIHPMVTYISDPWFGGAGLINLKWSRLNSEKTNKLIEVFERSIALIEDQPEKTKPYLAEYLGTSLAVSSKIPLVQYRFAETLSASEKNAVDQFLSIFHYYGYTQRSVKIEGLIFKKGQQ